MASMMKNQWHALPADDVIDQLSSDRVHGLPLAEVDIRQEQFGPNRLTGKKETSPIVRLLLQFHQALIYILLAAGAITAFLREWVDAGVIFGVVLVNACIGYLQEAKAVKAIEALARTMTTEATVVRAGEKRRIPSADVVPGDIVLLQSGDKVPADMRLLAARELQIDESALTGESMPVEKNVDPLAIETVLADRRNMAYASTLVTYGQGIGIVVATGDHTEVGRISQLISMTEQLETPLTRKISAFSRVLLYAILALAAATFVVGIIRGKTVFAMFMAAVALAVGAIPEGLPAAVTITLAIGVGRMAKRRAIVRRLPAVETLGSTTVICTDKTGTLTENQMTVQEIMAGGESFFATGVGYEPVGGLFRPGESEPVTTLPVPLRECLKAGLLCNDSLLLEEDGRWTIQGDPTEGALLVAARKAGLDSAEEQGQWPRVDAIPFESEYQYMATMHAGEGVMTGTVYLKGAVEAILGKCSDALDASGQHGALDVEYVHTIVEKIAAKGLRVLAFAKGPVRLGTGGLEHGDVAVGLTFLGLQGMIDPPRAEAIAAVRHCHSAGISVKMITGDHVATAAAIAGMIGLHDPDRAITGKTLAELSAAELIETAELTSVFARVTPEQKLRLVEALQARGHVVAMTGDGVNDAPALKRADIGVAMGVTGTDVAKEAADMVLTDDNFASIEAAIEEGRGVFDNLTKFIIWTLPTNLGEGLVILAAIIAGAELPILPVQILWINMTTAVLLGLMLAFEPKEPGIMQRRPRDPKTPMLSGVLVWRIVIVGLMLLAGSFGLFEIELRHGSSAAEARTVAVNVFVMVEIFYLFNCRSLTQSVFRLGMFSNPWVFGGVAIMTFLQLLYTYLPAMNLMFQSAPISAASWGRIMVVAVSAFFLVGVEKWLRNNRTLVQK